MQSKIDKALVQKQYVFDHVPIGFRFLVAIEIVPPHRPQLCLESDLHGTELGGRKEIGQNNDALSVESPQAGVDECSPFHQWKPAFQNNSTVPALDMSIGRRCRLILHNSSTTPKNARAFYRGRSGR